VIGRRAGQPGAILLVFVFAVLSATQAHGQVAAGRLDVSGGLRWNGKTAFAEVDATETSPGGQRLTLFKSRSSLESSAGFETAIGIWLTSRFEAEVALIYSPTQVRTDVTADYEAAQPLAVTEPIKQFIIQGGLVVPLGMLASGRITPFVSGGGGYLRQLHDGQTLIQTGAPDYAGGGVNILLRSGTGWIKTTGVRADLRAQFLTAGVAPDGGTHAVPAAGASLFVRF
jgi:hypothetical protein